jgi:HNH endonuclease
MSLCIFCDAELGENTKPEHVLLNALGGRMTTKRVICSECNNLFGSGIDKALTDQAATFRNLLQLESGSGSTAPIIKNVKAGDQTLNLRGDGEIELVRKPFLTTPNPDGSVKVQINARSVEELERLIPHVAASLKMPEQKLREQMAGAIASVTEQRPNTIHFPTSFGGVDAIRSATKACLVLWTTLMGNDEVRRDVYAAVRRFVTEGDDGFNRSRVSLDARPLPKAEEIKRTYGPVFNLIYVMSDSSGRVIGHFTLYNVISFQVVLAEAGGVPNRQIALVSNPVNPETRSADAASEFDISFSWLNKPDYQVDQAKQRLVDLMEYYFESQRPKEFGRMIEDVLQKNGLRENDAIPQVLAEKLGREMAERITKYQFGLPHEEKMTLEELLARARRDKPNGD